MGLFHKVEVGGATLIAVQDSWAALPPTAFFNQTEDSDWGQLPGTCSMRTATSRSISAPGW